MFTLALLLIVAIFAIVIVVGFVGTVGLTTLLLFGDLIVAIGIIWFIVWIIKKIRKK